MRQLQITLASALILCCCPGSQLTAQQQKTIPPGFGLVPGNSKLTYPFGRPTGGVQVIIDSSWITSGTATLTGLRMRPTDTNSKSYAGTTKNYQLDVATTPVSAAGMSKVPATNLGSAVATTVFQGPINLPGFGPQARVPDSFAVSLPFATPYTYASSQGNFVFKLESMDLAAVPSTWPVDSVNLRTSVFAGLAEKIGDGCLNNSDSLSLSVDTASLVVGNSLNVDLKSSTQGAFPTGFVLFGLSPLDADLSVFGMTGCRLFTTDTVAVTVNETGGLYPRVQLPIPNQPTLEGAALIVQALGWRSPQSSSLAGSVMSAAYGVRVGAPAGPIVHGQCIFSRDLNSWFMAKGSIFMPVVQLVGVIP